MAASVVGPLILVFLLVCLGGCLYLIFAPYTPDGRGARRQLLGCLGSCVACVVLVALILPAIPMCGEATRRSRCTWNLKQIVLGMQDYADKCGSFPPAYTVDEAGRSLHSWRVLLLPFLGQADLYGRVRLEEPCDSLHNRALFDSLKYTSVDRSLSMPEVYWCPSDRKNRTETNYVMILGPRTISNGLNAVRLKDITDGASNTIAVVETYGLGIRWYEPRDLRVDEMGFSINDSEYVGVASRHPGGVDVGLADGSVRFLPLNTDPRAAEAMTTINGEEDVSAVLK